LYFIPSPPTTTTTTTTTTISSYNDQKKKNNLKDSLGWFLLEPAFSEHVAEVRDSPNSLRIE
jgi:hypothetical protein